MPFVHDIARAFMPYPDVPVPRAAAGPLAGLTLGVKDLFDVAGYPTSGGQPFVLAMSGIKVRTASTVQRLLNAGAVFAGKTITDEFAYSMNGSNAHFGAPINGAAPDRITGGSSCGSAAAVSHRLVDFALGTDTGGSVRGPASHCGLVGLRPTQGRVSLEGALDLSPSFDTCGWFTRDVPTFDRIAEVLLGEDANSLPPRVRLLSPQDVWGLIAPPVRAAFEAPRERVLRALGPASTTNVALDSFEAMTWSFRYLQSREAWMTAGGLIERFQPPMGATVADRFAWARGVTDAQVAQGLAFRARFKAHLQALLGDDGVLVMPTMPDIAPLRSDSESALNEYRVAALQMLSISGLAGVPQLSLPLATRLGAPLGLSLVGPAGSDRSLVRLALRIVDA